MSYRTKLTLGHGRGHSYCPIYLQQPCLNPVPQYWPWRPSQQHGASSACAEPVSASSWSRRCCWCCKEPLSPPPARCTVHGSRRRPACPCCRTRTTWWRTAKLTSGGSRRRTRCLTRGRRRLGNCWSTTSCILRTTCTLTRDSSSSFLLSGSWASSEFLGSLSAHHPAIESNTSLFFHRKNLPLKYTVISLKRQLIQ